MVATFFLGATTTNHGCKDFSGVLWDRRGTFGDAGPSTASLGGRGEVGRLCVFIGSRPEDMPLLVAGLLPMSWVSGAGPSGVSSSSESVYCGR